LKALINPTEINVHVTDSQENRSVISDAKLFCLCCCTILCGMN